MKMEPGAWGYNWVTMSLGDIYRVIQEELPPLMELISEDILSKKCHININLYH
jgi:hypothetical protein